MVLDIDQHYIFFLFGIRLFSIKHRHTNVFPEIRSSGVTDKKRNVMVVASMTSYPERISFATLALKTVLSQTMKPDIVVLWLAESQFLNKEKDLPRELLELTEYGLTIRWCEDIGSYKKLIPSLKCYPNDIIITLDDDICYAHDTIESLYSSYQNNPTNVHAHRCGKVCIRNDRIINIPTCYLYKEKFNGASFYYRLTGHAGVLYPPNVFTKDVFDGFYEKLPTHDDVWFWAMLVKNKIKIRQVKGYTESVYPIDGSQIFGLCKKNNSKSKVGMSIDRAYQVIVDHYPDVMQSLLDEGI